MKLEECLIPNIKFKLSQTEFDNANMELIINTISPYSLIEHPAFVKYCKTVANKVPVSRKTLMKNIDQCFQSMKKDMITLFEKIDNFCITADCWTAFKKQVFIY